MVSMGQRLLLPSPRRMTHVDSGEYSWREFFRPILSPSVDIVLRVWTLWTFDDIRVLEFCLLKKVWSANPSVLSVLRSRYISLLGVSRSVSECLGPSWFPRLAWEIWEWTSRNEWFTISLWHDVLMCFSSQQSGTWNANEKPRNHGLTFRLTVTQFHPETFQDDLGGVSKSESPTWRHPCYLSGQAKKMLWPPQCHGQIHPAIEPSSHVVTSRDQGTAAAAATVAAAAWASVPGSVVK